MRHYRPALAPRKLSTRVILCFSLCLLLVSFISPTDFMEQRVPGANAVGQPETARRGSFGNAASTSVAPLAGFVVNSTGDGGDISPEQRRVRNGRG